MVVSRVAAKQQTDLLILWQVVLSHLLKAPHQAGVIGGFKGGRGDCFRTRDGWVALGYPFG